MPNWKTKSDGNQIQAAGFDTYVCLKVSQMWKMWNQVLCWTWHVIAKRKTGATPTRVNCFAYHLCFSLRVSTKCSLTAGRMWVDKSGAIACYPMSSSPHLVHVARWQTQGGAQVKSCRDTHSRAHSWSHVALALTFPGRHGYVRSWEAVAQRLHDLNGVHEGCRGRERASRRRSASQIAKPVPSQGTHFSADSHSACRRACTSRDVCRFSSATCFASAPQRCALSCPDPRPSDPFDWHRRWPRLRCAAPADPYSILLSPDWNWNRKS